MNKLSERLRATATRKSFVATNRTAPIIQNEYEVLVNPDGPEAATLLEQAEAALGRINRRASANPERTSGDAEAELMWIADEARALLAKLHEGGE